MISMGIRRSFLGHSVQSPIYFPVKISKMIHVFIFIFSSIFSINDENSSVLSSNALQMRNCECPFFDLHRHLRREIIVK